MDRGIPPQCHLGTSAGLSACSEGQLTLPRPPFGVVRLMLANLSRGQPDFSPAGAPPAPVPTPGLLSAFCPCAQNKSPQMVTTAGNNLC
jgi:hypothetical protein